MCVIRADGHKRGGDDSQDGHLDPAHGLGDADVLLDEASDRFVHAARIFHHGHVAALQDGVASFVIGECFEFGGRLRERGLGAGGQEIFVFVNQTLVGDEFVVDRCDGQDRNAVFGVDVQGLFGVAERQCHNRLRFLQQA